MTATPSEAEVKVELKSLSEVNRVRSLLVQLGLSPAATHTLKEYYLSRTPSPLGGWDFERLRNINDAAFIHTAKKWATDSSGQRIRLEEEDTLPESTFHQRISQGYDFAFTKERSDFTGMTQEKQLTVSIDTILLNGVARYFIECETITNQEEAYAARNQLKRWMERYLSLDTETEAPSMIDLITSTK